MRILIIEDEVHNLRMLADMLQTLRPGWTIAGQLGSVRQSVSFLKGTEQPDLILMDIQLSDGTCFSVFDQVEVKSAVIFTTAFDQYAIQAFKVNSIDYLLKPVKQEELEKALVKFEQLWGLQLNRKMDVAAVSEAVRQGRKAYRTRLLVESGNRYYRIETRDIACFTSEDKVTTALTFSGEKHVVDFSLDRLEEELDPGLYFRANRKTIVHIDLVARFEDYFGSKLMVKLKSPVSDRITVSRLKASAFKVWMGK